LAALLHERASLGRATAAILADDDILLSLAIPVKMRNFSLFVVALRRLDVLRGDRLVTRKYRLLLGVSVEGGVPFDCLHDRLILVTPREEVGGCLALIKARDVKVRKI